ncbi:MAG: hypothetical protein HYX27_23265 [Acidobacteria bacterium]|nr:hypothetical protein [Acidobacteriota bacterium]
MHALPLLCFLASASPDALVEQLRQQGAVSVKVHRVQLDRDAPLEAVVQYELPGSGVHAQVLDEANGTWRVAGKFNSWWNYVPGDAERFVEFRETVEAGVQDLLVRIRGGGTEDSRTLLEIYRLREGALVSVLSIKEQETAMEHPSGDVYATNARVQFAKGRVTVNYVKKPGGATRCVMYVWKPVQFRFDEESCLP